MYGSYDQRGLRVPRMYGGNSGYNTQTQNQYGAHNQGMTNDIGTTRTEQMMQGGMGGMSTVMRADYNTAGTHQQNYNSGNQYGSQYGNYANQNQYGAYGRGMTNDIGTTRSEQQMQGGMGGMSTAMRADYNTAGTHQQNYAGGQYSGNQYGSQYGNYANQNQYGAYGRGMTNDIGTTRSEQQMQGMGGLSTAMNADYNTAGTHQQNYNSGNQYGSQYGNYANQNQYGAYGRGMTNDIGTTRSEQQMQGMGGLSTAMNADYNTAGTHQQNYAGGQYSGNQYGSQYGNYANQNQYGAYGRGMTNDIGTTRSEQQMQGMGGLSTAMNADYNTAGTHQQNYTGGNQFGGSQYGGQNTNTQYSQGMYGGGSYGQYGTQSSTSGNQGTYNPGDTAIERQAKQNMGVNNTSNMGGTYGNEF